MARKRDAWRQEQVERKRQLAHEWEEAASPRQFFHFLEDATERKRRLFANACCRRIVHLCREEWAGRVLEASERIAEGAEYEPWLSEVWQLFDPDGIGVSDMAISMLAARGLELTNLDDLTRWAGYAANRLGGVTGGEPNPQEQQAQCALLREILGNPFQILRFSPSWCTDTAINLAKQMYESREFGAMPILADALQDAGCDSADVLDHCRDPQQVHVRGCWVVDLVSGKA